MIYRNLRALRYQEKDDLSAKLRLALVLLILLLPPATLMLLWGLPRWIVYPFLVTGVTLLGAIWIAVRYEDEFGLPAMKKPESDVAAPVEQFPARPAVVYLPAPIRIGVWVPSIAWSVFSPQQERRDATLAR